MSHVVEVETKKCIRASVLTKVKWIFLFVCRVFKPHVIMNKNLLSALVVAVLLPNLIFGQNTVNTPLDHVSPIDYRTVSKTSNGANSASATANENDGEKCLQHSRTEELKNTNEQYRQGWESARETTWRIADELRSGERAAPPVYTIPVVFHVIHKGESVGTGTNISDAQILSAIDALNRDYRRTSADGGIGQGAGPDTEIQFCLATVNPSGNPTSGINRVNGTSVSGYSANGITSSNESNVKALSRWDNRYYMNVWVVSEIDGNGADLANPANWSGGTLGYAYQPTNPVTWNSDLDGIVAVNLCVGNDPNQSHGYRLWPWGGLTNRTLTHEVGHFLSLDHTFEGQSCSESNCNTQGDGICDTPPTVQGSTCNSPACPNTQVENYMDYTDETCQDQFTTGQSTAMRATLAGVRNALVNTSNCGVSASYDASITAISVPNGTLCDANFTPVVTLTNYGSNTLTSVQIQYYVDANAPSTYPWTGSLATNSSATVTLNSLTTTSGSHTFTAKTVSGTLNGSNTDQTTSNDQTTSSFNVSSSGTAATLTLDLDCYGEEITWEIRNASNQLMASGGPYVNNTNGEQVVESFCLAQGCYDFNIFDSYGDGMYGSQWSGCTIDGDYEITQGNTTLVSMTATNGDFGSSATHNFCIGGGGGGGTTCEDLLVYDGESFVVNNNDFPNFDIQSIDNDQQAVNTNLAQAGYTSNWMAGFYEVVAPGDTNWFVGVTSWFANTSAVSDDWFTFGPVTMLDDDGEISWNHMYPDNDYRDGYEVLVGTVGTAIADFNGATVLYSASDNDPSTDGDTTWTPHAVTLPAGTYANQSLYFAVHHNALDMFLLFLDDLVVEGCSTVTVDVTEEQQFKMNVYPNPSSENFTFQYLNESGEKIDFALFNTMGQQVWGYQNNGRSAGTQIIDTHGLASGVYTLVVKGEKLNVSERLILTR